MDYRMRIGAVALGAVCLAALAACGGKASGTGSTAAAAGAGAGGMQAYVNCMSQNGVTITMPSGGPGGGMPPSGRMPTGRPSGAPRSGRPSGGPSGGPGGGGMMKPSGVDDQTWQKAQQACASLRPSRGPAPSPTG